MPSRIRLSLNKKETVIFQALPVPAGGKDGAGLTIADLASCFPKKGTSAGTKGNSWVRNSLRKLVKLGLVKGQGKRSGVYFRPATSVEVWKTMSSAKDATKDAA